MARQTRSTEDWFLDSTTAEDGVSTGGFDSVTVLNFKTSDFGVKVFFGGFFKFGLNPGESRTEALNGKNVVITVRPGSTPEKGETAAGVFDLANARQPAIANC